MKWQRGYQYSKMATRPSLTVGNELTTIVSWILLLLCVDGSNFCRVLKIPPIIFIFIGTVRLLLVRSNQRTRPLFQSSQKHSVTWETMDCSRYFLAWIDSTQFHTDLCSSSMVTPLSAYLENTRLQRGASFQMSFEYPVVVISAGCVMQGTSWSFLVIKI